MTPERIAELRAIIDAATPGPWDFDTSGVTLPDGTYLAWGEMYEVPEYNMRFLSARFKETDANFVAAARTALPEALDAIQRVRELAESYSPESRGYELAKLFLLMLESRPND